MNRCYTLLAALLLLVGCDSTGGEENEEGLAPGTVTAQIDGETFSAGSGTALLVEQEDASALPDGLTVVVTGTDGTLVTISLYPFNGKGTYTASQDEHAARVDLPQSSGEPASFSTNLGGNGVVEVSEQTEEEVRGTFRFTALSEDEDAVQVTEGRFRVALSRGNQVIVEKVCPGREVFGEGSVFIAVEELPELIGGFASLQARLVYPAAARADGAEGRVVVQFIVGPNGEVFDLAVLRSPHDAMSSEALRLIQTAAFRPGKQRGNPVCVKLSLPVTFTLEYGTGLRAGLAGQLPSRRRMHSL